MPLNELSPFALSRLTGEERKQYEQLLKWLAQEEVNQKHLQEQLAAVELSGRLPALVEEHYRASLCRSTEYTLQRVQELSELLAVVAAEGLPQRAKGREQSHLHRARQEALGILYNIGILERSLQLLGVHDAHAAWEGYLQHLQQGLKETASKLELLQQEVEDFRSLAIHTTVGQGRGWLREAHEEACHPGAAGGGAYWRDPWR